LSRAYALTPPTSRHPASCRARGWTSGASGTGAQRPPGAFPPTGRARHTALLGAPGRRVRAAEVSRFVRVSEHSLGRDGCRRARALGAGGVERAV